MDKILKFDESEFIRICEDDHEHFKLIERIEGASSRWSREITIIVKLLENDTYYMGSYEEGATECQENSYDFPELTRCKQIEVKRLKWIEED
jgi:hypothetical protein